jgi:predicted nucleic acid-binding protein
MILLAPDVLLDVVLARHPHAEAAAQLLDRIVRGDLEATVAADTVALVWQVADRAVGTAQARGVVEQLLALVPVTPLTGPALLAALASPVASLEAALLHAVAHEAHASAIVTRDPAPFAGATLAIRAPAQVLASLG